MTNPTPPELDKAARRRNIIVAVLAVSVSLFMYATFILKTAIKGP